MTMLSTVIRINNTLIEKDGYKINKINKTIKIGNCHIKNIIIRLFTNGKGYIGFEVRTSSSHKKIHIKCKGKNHENETIFITKTIKTKQILYKNYIIKYDEEIVFDKNTFNNTKYFEVEFNIKQFCEQDYIILPNFTKSSSFGNIGSILHNNNK